MPRRDIITVPVRFDARVLPPKKRQASIAHLYSEEAFDVASATADEAPLVGRVVHPNREGGQEYSIAYRAARGLDGKVRLMAPLDSPAFPAAYNHRHDGVVSPLLYLERLNPMYSRHSPAQSAGNYEARDMVASDRRLAMETMKQRLGQMCLVDGVLHAEVTPPRWVFRFGRFMDRTGTMVPDAATLESPEREKRIGLYTKEPDSPAYVSLAEAPTAGDAFRVAMAKGQIPQREYTWAVQNSRFEDGVPEAMVTDRAWEDLRYLAAVGLMVVQHDKLDSTMLRQEQDRVRRVQDALWDWQGERNPRLAVDIYAFALALHGEKSNGLAKFRSFADEVLKDFQTSRAPASLERRLEAVGIHVPGLVQDQEAVLEGAGLPRL